MKKISASWAFVWASGL